MDTLKLNITPRKSSLDNLELKEPIDVNLLDKLLSSSLLKQSFNNPMSGIYFDNEKEQLIRYKNLIKDGSAYVKYNQVKGMNFGRVNPKYALGLFSIRREIRHTLGRDIYCDIDIENCHPVLLYQICKNKMECKKLKKYVKHRDTILKQVMDYYEVTRDDAKKLFIALMYVGGFNNWIKKIEKEKVQKGQIQTNTEPLSFIKEFKKEIQTIGNTIMTNNPELKKRIEKSKELKKIYKDDYNIVASTLSYFLQEYECQILELIFNYCVENDLIENNIAVLCADGLMIKKENYNHDLLETFSKLVETNLGFKLRFTQKQLDQGYSIEEIEKSQVPQTLSINIFNDKDAANQIYGLYPHWVCCNEELYVYDSDNGLWSNSETIHYKILGKFSNELKICRRDMDGKIIKTDKGYGDTTNLKRQLLPEIKTICINNDWLLQTEKTSLKKLLFNNGYLDLLTGIFHKEFDPKIVFIYKINQNYDPETIDDVYLSDIKTRLFENPLGKDVADFFLLSLSRGIAGDIMKRILFGLGSSNGGKSTITKALRLSFGDYVGSFNAGNLSVNTKSSGDEAQKLRWAMLLRFKRLILSNEIKMENELNGNEIKKISSGGDAITGRCHNGNETEFIPHFLSIVLANDLPKISPYDDAVDNRIKVVGFNKIFVDKPKENCNEYELPMDKDIENEISTDKFKQHFVHLITQRYITYITKDNKIEKIPEEVLNSKKMWIGDLDENSIIAQFQQNYKITNNKEDFIESKTIQNWISESKVEISIKKFSLELSKHCSMNKFDNVKSGQKREKTRVFNVYYGIAVNEDDEDEDDKKNDDKKNDDDDDSDDEDDE